MYDNTPEQKRALKIVLGFYFCFILVSGFVFYLHGDRTVVETAFVGTQPQEVIPTGQVEPTDSVLGVFNSVTLTPTPQSNTNQTEQKQNQQLQAQKPPVSISKIEVYSLINSYRQSQNLPPVAVDARLENSSMNKARDMVASNYFEHRNPWSFINGADYSFNYAAENLAINYYSSSSLVRGWQNSPSHNKALLDERNQHMGLAFICDITVTQYKDTCLAVIHFARPSE